MAIVFAPVSTITIVRGTDWVDDVSLVNEADQTPVDLTGALGLWMRIRETPADPVLLDLSLADGRIVLLDAANGSIGFRVMTADTLALPENDHERASYGFDLVIEREVGRYEAGVRGRINVDPQYARPWETT